MKKAVIIGSGQSGRGYLARYLFEKKYKITFIDIDKALIDLLQEDQAFTIHFYKKDRTPMIITGFTSVLAYSPEATQAIFEADLILTAVGEQNLSDVAEQLKLGFIGKTTQTIVITAENGINPGKVLREKMKAIEVSGDYIVSQTAIFCSTVIIKETRLDILSQNETYFPYDCEAWKGCDFNGAVPILDFEKFFKRKIYTYNCLAGLISYCGYIKNYEVYGEAANDPDVSEIMDRLLKELNPALIRYFEITKEDQISFANRALDKFKDRSILDYTVKNGRAPSRKLASTERIMAPMKIIEDNHGDTRIMEFIAAAALCYWDELQGKGIEPWIGKAPIEAFVEINRLKGDEPLVGHIQTYFEEIKKQRQNINIVNILYGSEKAYDQK